MRYCSLGYAHEQGIRVLHLSPHGEQIELPPSTQELEGVKQSAQQRHRRRGFTHVAPEDLVVIDTTTGDRAFIGHNGRERLPRIG